MTTTPVNFPVPEGWHAFVDMEKGVIFIFDPTKQTLANLLGLYRPLSALAEQSKQEYFPPMPGAKPVLPVYPYEK